MPAQQVRKRRWELRGELESKRDAYVFFFDGICAKRNIKKIAQRITGANQKD